MRFLPLSEHAASLEGAAVAETEEEEEEEEEEDVEVGVEERRERGKVRPGSVDSCACVHTWIFRWLEEGGMRGDGDTSVCISAAEPPLEKRERGRGKKGGEARKVGEPTYRGGKEGEKRSEARETRLPQGGRGGGEAMVGVEGVEKRANDAGDSSSKC